VRTDLESAMAAVITSRAANASFGADGTGFATAFGLAPEDIDRLTSMGEDLVQLTNSFVAKRANTLRWNARRTLSLLGRDGTAMVDDYINGHPATDSFANESARFGEFVISETDARRDGSERADIIAEMARFERLRSASFWGNVASVEQASAGVSPRSSNAEMHLRPGADAASFEWDLRPLYHQRGATGELPTRDPCVLCFVHVGSSLGFRVLRLTDAEFQLVASLMDGGPASGRTGEQSPDQHRADEWVVDRLTRRRVIEWR
jgi:hypothetical protein